MRPRGSPTPTLTPELLTLMVAGPWAIGQTLLTMPTHGRLRTLWQTHETVIRAEAARRGREQPWFLDRDWFVRLLDGEDV